MVQRLGKPQCCCAGLLLWLTKLSLYYAVLATIADASAVSRRSFRFDYRSAESFREGDKAERLTMGFDAPDPKDKLKNSDTLEHALDIFNTRVDTAKILDYNLNQLKQAYDPEFSFNPDEADRGQIDSVLVKIKARKNLLEQVNREAKYASSKHSKYTSALVKIKLDVEKGLIREALENPKLAKALEKTLKGTSHPELLRLSKVLKMYTHSPTWWERLKLLFHKFFGIRTKNRVQVEAKEFAKRFRKPFTLNQKRMHSVIQEVAVEELVATALWRGEFLEEECRLLKQLFKNPKKLSKDQETLVEKLYSAFLIRQIPPNFLDLNKEWVDMIQKISLSTEEELDKMSLSQVPEEELLEDQKAKLEMLKKKHLISQKLQSNLKRVEEIRQKLIKEEELSHEESAFMFSSFSEQMGILQDNINREVLAWDIPENHVRHSGWFWPVGRSRSNFLEHQEIVNDGNYLFKTLTDDELSFINTFKEQIDESKGAWFRKPKKSAISFANLYGYSSCIDVIESRSPHKIRNLTLHNHEIKGLNTLMEKIEERLSRRLELTPVEREAGQQLIKEEHKRLESLSAYSKGKEMLKVIQKSQMHPTSVTEDELIQKLDLLQPLDNSDTNLLHKLGDKYQKIIINTMSENDVLLSHLIWLEANGQNLEHYTYEGEMRASELKAKIEKFADSPLEKYILFATIKKRVAYSFESMFQQEMQSKEALVGQLTEVEHRIYSGLQQPLWKRTLEGPDERDFMLEVFSSLLKSLRGYEEAAEVLDQYTNGSEHLALPSSLTRNLHQHELGQVEQLWSENQEGFSTRDNHARSKLCAILATAEARRRLAKGSHSELNQPFFYNSKVLSKAREIEKIKTLYEQETEKLEDDLSAIWKLYSSAVQ
ncbi:hypothetical protein CROQUDRAFT_86606 [Cronartium quercuum f. sp. fusiforme G11]|uniref:Uncharacterized protein n=1 Tax=Cronartium quercuum f. sp. fusiforme G11 TaxID=708437 RepID=A0A9P6NWE6_9BASI|nr:hypothetical protein CROQUDRAFT_86606 [Cronartium quercuum f. sp. fusiforme G11]